jgi:hypothetical protein
MGVYATGHPTHRFLVSYVDNTLTTLESDV